MQRLTTILLALMLSGLAIAEEPAKQVDQQYVLDMKPVAVDIGALNKILVASGFQPELKEAEVGEVLRHVLRSLGRCPQQTELAKDPGGCLDPQTYYILHLVQLQKGSPKMEHDAWYVYFNGWVKPDWKTKWADLQLSDHYKDARLFGARRITLLYLHYDVSLSAAVTEACKVVEDQWSAMAKKERESIAASQRAMASEEPKPQATIKKEASATPQTEAEAKAKAAAEAKAKAEDDAKAKAEAEAKADADARQAAQAACQGLFQGNADGQGRILSENSKKLAPVVLAHPAKSSNEVRLVEEDFFKVVYQADITKKLPQNWANLKGLAEYVLQGVTRSIALPFKKQERTALVGIKDDMRIDYPTSDIKITALRDSSEFSNKTYDNEKRHWWDFSFAINFKGIEDLKLDSGAVVPKAKVERKDLYAMANIFPVPVDIKRSRLRLVPQFMYGMGITGKPWDRHLFAVGIGTNFAQPFIGYSYSRIQETAPTEQTTGLKWKGQLTYGLNFQVKAIQALFSKATE